MSYLDKIPENARARAALRSILDEGRLHAVMLLMPAGCYRERFARYLAAEHIGTAGELVLAGAHPDCLIVAGEGKSGQIKTDTLGRAIFEISRAGAMGAKRAIIVEDAGALNAFSAAKLLKSLEEPPAGVMYILSAAGTDCVISTVVSRCACVSLEVPSDEAATEYAREKYPTISDERLSLAIGVYGGKTEYVDGALSSVKGLETAKNADNLCRALLGRDKLAVMAALSLKREELLPLVDATLCALENAVRRRGEGARELGLMLTLSDELSRFVSVHAAAAKLCVDL